MKKILLTTVAIFAFGWVQAQDLRFGVKGGLFLSSYDTYHLHNQDHVEHHDSYYGPGDYDDTASNGGIYIGGLLEFELMDKLKLQPELTFSAIAGDDGYIALNIPVMAKYSFFDKFYGMAGPAINYALDGDDDQFSPSFNFGASYDLMQNFYVEARADVGLSGYLGTNLNAGVGYRF